MQCVATRELVRRTVRRRTSLSSRDAPGERSEVRSELCLSSTDPVPRASRHAARCTLRAGEGDGASTLEDTYAPSRPRPQLLQRATSEAVGACARTHDGRLTCPDLPDNSKKPRLPGRLGAGRRVLSDPTLSKSPLRVGLDPRLPGEARESREALGEALEKPREAPREA